MALTRLAVGHSLSVPAADIDLPALKALAEEQGLLAVVLDGYEKYRAHSPGNGISTHSKELGVTILLAQWIGEVSQLYEQRYEQYIHAISDLAAFYNSHGFKMMVLKGFACSLDWPKPEHRPCGDIDIWLFGQQKEADAVLTREKGIEIDTSHHHHTVFDWQGFMVENHYDFINVHHHKSHAKLEAIFKGLGADDTHTVEVNGERVYLPSPNLHALFLLKHNALHFSTGEMTLRQLLDWGFFVERHGKEVDWKWLDEILEQYGMKPIYGIINAICVEELGFCAEIFSYVQFEPGLKKRVLNDIFAPKFGDSLPPKMFPRLLYKYRRWKANEWKHELCYKESMWSAFWSGVWNHLLKPSSI